MSPARASSLLLPLEETVEVRDMSSSMVPSSSGSAQSSTRLDFAPSVSSSPSPSAKRVLSLTASSSESVDGKLTFYNDTSFPLTLSCVAGSSQLVVSWQGVKERFSFSGMPPATRSLTLGTLDPECERVSPWEGDFVSFSLSK